MGSKLTNVEKLSYGLGNFGINLIFGMTGAYLLYFYTDVYRVDASTVALLFLVARGADAVFDPLLGLMIDRTDTRYGKHRPYLAALAVPFALCGVAVFSTPALAGVPKIAYLFVTYTLLGMLYSGLSLPLNSMLPTLTRNAKERTSTNALREFFGTTATVGVGYVTLPFVHAIGAGSEARGFFRVALVFGAMTLVGVLVAFVNTRERELPESSPNILSTRQSLKATRGNLPWIATLLVNLFFWIGFIAHVQSVVYYAKDVIGRPEIVSSLMLTLLVTLVGTALSALVANRIGKRLTGMIGAAIAAIAIGSIPLSNGLPWLMAMNSLAYAGLGLIGGLLFAFMADAVDYGEWKSGYRAQGFLFAASSFGVKVGLSIGGAAGAWLLSRSHYVAGAPITPAVALAISLGHVWIPVVSFAAMGASLILFVFSNDYAGRRLHPATA